jgi:hypothetical protein
VCQHDLGGTIDASPFVDPSDGTPYLLFKSDTNAPHIGGTARLFSQQLDPSGTALVGQPVELVRTSESWEQPLIENPDMFRSADGRLWLTYSANWWPTTRYSTGLASCATPMGPCTKLGQWLSSDDGYHGPGGLSFLDDQGRPVVAFHQWAGGTTFEQGGVRETVIRTVSFEGEIPEILD